MGDVLRDIAANRQVCPTILEMTFGNQSKSTRKAQTKWRCIPILSPFEVEREDFCSLFGERFRRRPEAVKRLFLFV